MGASTMTFAASATAFYPQKTSLAARRISGRAGWVSGVVLAGFAWPLDAARRAFGAAGDPVSST